jgi:Fuc2NAc and GlcNAc transferase
MTLRVALIALLAFAAAALMTGVIRRFAVSRGVLDVPNARSSHSTPTPRGGGAAIVLATTAALAALAYLGTLDRDVLVTISGGGTAVALVGLIDDHRPVAPTVRLLVHFAAAIWAIAWLGGFPTVQFAGTEITLGVAGFALGVLGIVWALNLFNFLDGIDGIAASEAVFVTCAGAGLLLLIRDAPGVAAAAFVFGASCCGFLLWNWPPAKIFMGDVGSGYLGYLVAVLALSAARHDLTILLVWLILGGVFFVDATVTLIRRLARGERVSQAHRGHAYQVLARRWGSHRRVTLLVIAINVFWLLPCAFIATQWPHASGWLLVAAWTPLVVGVCAAGGGGPEAVRD